MDSSYTLLSPPAETQQTLSNGSKTEKQHTAEDGDWSLLEMLF